MVDVENQRNSEISDSEMNGVPGEKNKPTESSGGLPLPMVVVCAFVAIATVAWVMSSHDEPGTQQNHESIVGGKHDEDTTEKEENKGDDTEELAWYHKRANQAAGGVCACGLVYVVGGDALPEWLYCGPCWSAAPMEIGHGAPQHGVCSAPPQAAQLEIQSQTEWRLNLYGQGYGFEPWMSFGKVQRGSDGPKRKILAETLVTDKGAAGLEDGEIALANLDAAGKVLKVTLASFEATVKKFDSSNTADDQEAIVAAFKATQNALIEMRGKNLRKCKFVLTPQFVVILELTRVMEFVNEFGSCMYARRFFRQC